MSIVGHPAGIKCAKKYLNPFLRINIINKDTKTIKATPKVTAKELVKVSAYGIIPVKLL